MNGFCMHEVFAIRTECTTTPLKVQAETYSDILFYYVRVTCFELNTEVRQQQEKCLFSRLGFVSENGPVS